MAGGTGIDFATMTFITNDNYYLYPVNENYWYWTMTPFAYSDGDAGAVLIGDFVNSYSVYVNFAVRPVVSLKSDAISGGVGTVNNPFYVNEKP